MGNIKAFLVPSIGDETKDVIISDRFKDEEGKVQPFKIKIITQDENEVLRKQASRPKKKNGMIIGEELDAIRYNKLLVLASVIVPDFHDQELCKYYGTLDPMEVPGKMLSAGEYSKLSNAILNFNGFNEDTDELEEEAKN